jgi:hypothetical protein
MSGLFLATAANGDSLIEITGDFVAVGNSVCGPTPCTETIAFDIELAPSILFPDENPAGPVVANFQKLDFSGSGPLGNYSGEQGDSFPGEDGPGTTAGFLYLNAGSQEEVDVIYSIAAVGGGFDVQLGTAFFFTCQSATCVSDFSTIGQPCAGTSCGAASFSAENLAYSQVPEPSSLLLLAGGLLLCIGALALLSRRLFTAKPTQVRLGVPLSAIAPRIYRSLDILLSASVR